MPIRAAVRAITYPARLITYRVPYERDPRPSRRTVEVMGANAWHSTLWAVRDGGLAEELDQQIIPGKFRSAAEVEAMHIQAWTLAMRAKGEPTPKHLAAVAQPVVIDNQEKRDQR